MAKLCNLGILKFYWNFSNETFWKFFQRHVQTHYDFIKFMVDFCISIYKIGIGLVTDSNESLMKILSVKTILGLILAHSRPRL